MSYDIYLEDDLGNTVHVPRHTDGGTYVLGGTTDAWINVTYNYCPYYYQSLDKDKGIKWLHNKRADDTIERLLHAVSQLGTERGDDYWVDTPGNAGYALSILLSWARLHPDAKWRVI